MNAKFTSRWINIYFLVGFARQVYTESTCGFTLYKIKQTNGNFNLI